MHSRRYTFNRVIFDIYAALEQEAAPVGPECWYRTDPSNQPQPIVKPLLAGTLGEGGGCACLALAALLPPKRGPPRLLRSLCNGCGGKFLKPESNTRNFTITPMSSGDILLLLKLETKLVYADGRSVCTQFFDDGLARTPVVMHCVLVIVFLIWFKVKHLDSVDTRSTPWCSLSIYINTAWNRVCLYLLAFCHYTFIYIHELYIYIKRFTLKCVVATGFDGML